MAGSVPAIPIRMARPARRDARAEPAHDEDNDWPAMSDISQLENEILTAVAAAQDEAALEAARVGALGKKGSISALLATLGKMSPEERRQQGP